MTCLPPEKILTARSAAPGARDAFPSGRLLVLTLLVLGAAPLIWPAVPPLIDLPNHMSRYWIGLAFDRSALFRTWFDFHWVPVGNLGVDLLVTGLAPLLGLEPATKLVILATPLLVIAGLLWIQREAYGRIHPLAALPAVFAYNFPFNFGFVNFTLSVALALVAFAFWIRLGRLGRTRLRAALFVPIGFAIWLCHVCGWGVLGVMAFGWEIASHRKAGKSVVRAGSEAALACLPMATPLLPMLFWSSRVPKASLGTFNYDPARKLMLFMLSLRNGQPWLDTVGAFTAIYLFVIALRHRDVGFDARIGTAGLLMLAIYVAMPSDLMGSGHADLRLAPYAALLILLALRPRRDSPFTKTLGAVALLFFAAEMLLHTVTYAQVARAQEHSLEALDHLPRDTTVFALAQVSCSGTMAGNRTDHVSRLATVRRDAVTNGTWPYPASQTLIVHPEMIRGYVDESSQRLAPADCLEGRHHTVAGALAWLPRDRYRYFWLLDTPQRLWPTRSWLRPVWHNDRTILYAVARPGEEQHWKSAAQRRPTRAAS